MVKELKMIKSHQIERKLGIDPEKVFCRICKFQDCSVFYFEAPCSTCKIIITNFEEKD